MKLISSEARLTKLSDISSNFGFIALASVALPAIFEKFDLIWFSVGTVGSIAFLILSILLIKS